MNVVGVYHLRQYVRGKPVVVANDLSNWEATAHGARWLLSADVIATFPTAVQISPVGDWEFPMPRCNATVQALVQYPTNLVLITKVR